MKVTQIVKAWIENAILHAQTIADSLSAGTAEKASWDPLNELMGELDDILTIEFDLPFLNSKNHV